MRKTSLYLNDQVDAALSRRAAREGVPKAEVIRRALAAAVAEAPQPPVVGIGTLDFPPIPPEDVDHELARTGFGLA